MGVVKEHSTTIDGILYTTKTLPASEGDKIFLRLVALLGEQLMALMFGAGSEGFATIMEDPRILGKILSNIATTASKREADQEDPTAVLRDILITTTAAPYTTAADKPLGEPGSVYQWYDTHFAGEYMHKIRVVGWVANVNFMRPSLGNLSLGEAGAKDSSAA